MFELRPDGIFRFSAIFDCIQDDCSRTLCLSHGSMIPWSAVLAKRSGVTMLTCFNLGLRRFHRFHVFTDPMLFEMQLEYKFKMDRKTGYILSNSINEHEPPF